jgi:hypothetical protein
MEVIQNTKYSKNLKGPETRRILFTATTIYVLSCVPENQSKNTSKVLLETAKRCRNYHYCVSQYFYCINYSQVFCIPQTIKPC